MRCDCGRRGLRGAGSESQGVGGSGVDRSVWPRGEVDAVEVVPAPALDGELPPHRRHPRGVHVHGTGPEAPTHGGGAVVGSVIPQNNVHPCSRCPGFGSVSQATLLFRHFCLFPPCPTGTTSVLFRNGPKRITFRIPFAHMHAYPVLCCVAYIIETPHQGALGEITFLAAPQFSPKHGRFPCLWLGIHTLTLFFLINFRPSPPIIPTATRSNGLPGRRR